MSAEENRNDAAEEAVNENPEVEVEATEATADAPADSGADGQVQELKDQLLRAQAEMQNIRRRASIDVEKAHKFALEKFVKELLPVVDSLEKAVESTEGTEASGDVVANIREGVEMTLSLLTKSLEKFNVQKLNPVGEPFDPQHHEAMSMVPAPDAEPNSVVAVVQKGYTLNERLVRPAMVVVAKAEGGSKIDEQA